MSATRFVRTTSGLLVQEGFSDLTAWANDGVWAAAAAPSMVVFDPTPAPLFGPGPGDDSGVTRQPLLYVEGGTWYLLYDAGPANVDNNPFVPPQLFGQHMAISTDRGKTWTRTGLFSINTSNGGAADSVVSTATGWLEKRSGAYYLFRVTTPSSIISGPFYGDMWTGPSPTGPWTLVGEVPRVPGTWAAGQLNPGSVVYDPLTQLYHYFQEGSPVPNGGFVQGRSEGPTNVGPWTLDPQTIADLPDGRAAENAKCFWHPTLQRWMILYNVIAPSGSFTDQNMIFVNPGTNIRDWSTAVAHRIQHVSPLDSPHAIGVISYMVGPEAAPVFGADGSMPVVFDAHPTYNPSGWHFGRSIYGATLEASPSCGRYTQTGDSTLRSLVRTLAHTDLVAEYTVEMRTLAGGGEVTLEFRRQGNSDCYRLALKSTGLVLQKRVSGVTTTLQTPTSPAETGAVNLVHRIRLVVSGSSITAVLNGEQQISLVDTTFASGVAIALAAAAVDMDIRRFSVRTSQAVTVTGLQVGQVVELRMLGGFLAQSAVAAGATVTFTVPHSPLDTLTVDGVDHQVAGGVWGGDTHAFISSRQGALMPHRKRRL